MHRKKIRGKRTQPNIQNAWTFNGKLATSDLAAQTDPLITSNYSQRYKHALTHFLCLSFSLYFGFILSHSGSFVACLNRAPFVSVFLVYFFSANTLTHTNTCVHKHWASTCQTRAELHTHIQSERVLEWAETNVQNTVLKALSRAFEKYEKWKVPGVRASTKKSPLWKQFNNIIYLTCLCYDGFWECVKGLRHGSGGEKWFEM